jgi:hypothetical protein
VSDSRQQASQHRWVGHSSEDPAVQEKQRAALLKAASWFPRAEGWPSYKAVDVATACPEVAAGEAWGGADGGQGTEAPQFGQPPVHQ